MSKTVVAYQGEPGAYSEVAATRLTAAGAALLPCRRFDDVFAALAAGRAQFAVLPYVNSLAGPVQASCSLLAREPVRVLDETVLPIAHALIALPGVARGELRYVSSHPVALKQCRRFLRRHPRLQVLPVNDTAGAVAQLAAHGRRDSAAIASERAAELYGAVVLEKEVQDSRENRTSFLLITALR
jgi:prephenate dehydratase